MPQTLARPAHYETTGVRIDKLVVGPYENNVFILRDKSTGERWFTVGVSPNIVDASFEALIDSITYKLLRAGAAA